ARVVEIIEQAYLEIKNYGHEEQKKKLIAGIVLTGGGAQLKHLKQLVEYITGMDTRIGFPNEHLAHDNEKELTSPQYATAVGLVMNSLEENKKKPLVAKEEVVEESQDDTYEDQPMSEETEQLVREHKERKNFFDKWVDKFKDFLDNAE
ncbi:MAG TPA: cell division protein FtsA, partial [Flavobacteriaceae bacterium]|nr:cell division protein FtsA [Flavobacteriaceae bacterium]